MGRFSKDLLLIRKILNNIVQMLFMGNCGYQQFNWTCHICTLYAVSYYRPIMSYPVIREQNSRLKSRRLKFFCVFWIISECTSNLCPLKFTKYLSVLQHAVVTCSSFCTFQITYSLIFLLRKSWYWQNELTLMIGIALTR